MKRGFLFTVGLSTSLASNQAISAVNQLSTTWDSLDLAIQYILALM
ncbi:MAG: hypothetical protein R3219_09275 [Hydrogenovibrio sp.]|nr:hypothetical protein [Hydrogenovibrio sp.]